MVIEKFKININKVSTGLLICLIFGLVNVSFLSGQEVWDTEEGIEESYYVMGEYYGSFDDDPNDKLGAQIRAEGGDKFRCTFLEGGLVGHDGYPFGGWDEENLSSRQPCTFNYGNGTMSWTANEWRGNLTIPTPVINASDEQRVLTGNKLGRNFTLTRVQRISPTMGWAPPEYARVLFDGTEAMFDTSWDITNGGSYDAERSAIFRGVDSKYLHRSGFFHVEYFGPYRPAATGQGRSNSGIYFKHVYEQQITDPFGIDGIQSNEGGGLYGQVPPLRNANLPTLRWMTYDVYFTDAVWDGVKTDNARFTTFLNGIMVHDDSQTSGPGTGGRNETDDPGPLFLQNHSNPVYFRNIWLIEEPGLYPDLDFIFNNPGPQCDDPTHPAYVQYAVWPSTSEQACPVVSIKNQQPDNFKINHRQNGEKLFVEIQATGKGSIEYTFMDLKGKVINEFKNGKRNVELDMGQLESGMYLLNVKSENFNFTRNIPVL